MASTSVDFERKDVPAGGGWREPPPPPRRVWPLVLAGLLSLLVVAGAVWAFALRSDDEGGEPAAVAPRGPVVLQALDLKRQDIYESPQEPGYTSWVGAWTMPDGALMTSFTQARGPVAPGRRGRVPASVLRAFGQTSWPPGRDFWNLDLSVVFLRSTDGGATWRKTRQDPYRALYPHAYTAQPTTALRDGTIIRRVNGDDLRQDAKVPHTAFIQRLAPGSDRWSEPQVLVDPAKVTYQLTRIRELRDGRLIATGNAWDVPASTKPPARSGSPSRFFLAVSSDSGRSWKEALEIPEEVGPLPGNEWDTAEMANGDLVAVMRTQEPPSTGEVRKQAILRKDGDGWIMRDVRRSSLPPSGHPELLATREGPIIHVATTGASYTNDGVTWSPLFSQRMNYRSAYYPRAVQLDDGGIRIFGHVGGDDDYGERDQVVRMDSFRLTSKPGTPSDAR